ncbi:MAG: RecB family exonuclease, partial [Mycobacteriales bacterium]
QVVHALADDVAAGRTPADLEAVRDALDRAWPLLAFEAPWQAARQRDDALAALARFLAAHQQDRDRALAGSEVPFDVTVDTPTGPVRLTGSLDRVEIAGDGSVWVVDLKTSRTPPSRAAVQADPQLGVYQLAVRHGALEQLPVARGRPCGGAELWQLRPDGPLPKVQQQASLPPGESSWIADLLGEHAAMVRAEAFSPAPSEDCQRCPFTRACPAQPEGHQVVP